ncbi:MAG: hypothetical protein ACOC7K_02610 [bacterium]
MKTTRYLSATTIAVVLLCIGIAKAGGPVDRELLASKKTQKEPSQCQQLCDFIRKHVVGKELVEPRERVVLKEGELEAETFVTREVTAFTENLHGFEFDMLINRRQTNYDLQSNEKRSGASYVKDHISVLHYRVGERLSTGELIGIVDERCSSMEEYPYSPMSLRIWLNNGVMVTELESIHYQDMYAPGNCWTAGVIQAREEFSVVNGKTQLKTTERGFDVDLKTGKRTARKPILESVSKERIVKDR